MRSRGVSPLSVRDVIGVPRPSSHPARGDRTPRVRGVLPYAFRNPELDTGPIPVRPHTELHRREEDECFQEDLRRHPRRGGRVGHPPELLPLRGAEGDHPRRRRQGGDSRGQGRPDGEDGRHPCGEGDLNQAGRRGQEARRPHPGVAHGRQPRQGHRLGGEGRAGVGDVPVDPRRVLVQLPAQPVQAPAALLLHGVPLPDPQGQVRIPLRDLPGADDLPADRHRLAWRRGAGPHAPEDARRCARVHAAWASSSTSSSGCSPTWLLHAIKGLRRIDKATVAGYYGSDSAGTFVTCLGVLASAHIAYNAYMPVMLAIMEVPGCLVALYLVSRLRHHGMDALGNMPDEPGYDPTAKPLLPVARRARPPQAGRVGGDGGGDGAREGRARTRGQRQGREAS